MREQQQRCRNRITAKVFDYYGRECACCGATGNLTIDHVDGGGTAHRIALFGQSGGERAGAQFYSWLIRQGYPDGYQVLCMSCNCSKNDGPACRINHAAVQRCG